MLSLSLPSQALGSPLALELEQLLLLAVSRTSAAELARLEIDSSVSLTERAESGFDPKITGKLGVSQINAEPQSPFSPKEAESQTLTAAYQKGFATGTWLAADLELERAQASLPGLPPNAPPSENENLEATVGISAKQQLWRNSFGEAQRQRLTAAHRSAAGVKLQAVATISDYALRLIETYFSAWLLQEQIRSGRDRIRRQERLLKLSAVKKNLGTLDEVDFLQLEANLLSVRDQVKDTERQLRNIWRSLVVSTHFGDQYIDIDPLTVRLSLKDTTEEATDKCKVADPDYNRQIGIMALDQMIAGQTATLAAVRSQAKPDLYLESRLASTGIDKRIGPAMDEMRQVTNPTASVALGVEVSLGGSDDRANLLDTVKSKSKLEIQKAQQIDTLRTRWRESCAELRDLVAQKATTDRSSSLLSRRLNLESKRFAVGKTDVAALIRSEDDVAATEFQRARLTAALGKIYWNLADVSGELGAKVASILGGR